ncbi:acetyl-CoA synthetase-like protein [Dichomitus squalens]|uniref:Acetyl-CoA synthetase-like protein n=1 Tax=Dichomitus squalens TaxID=114155 RepID=A0A4Q9MIU9_9APHY|nr:acetyl-CoA synthetase-like protein [Dichomitus squalens]
MSLHLAEDIAFVRLLAASAVVAAQSYAYRWTSSDEPSPVVLQVVDIRRRQLAHYNCYTLSVPSDLTVSQLLDVARRTEATATEALAKDALTLFTFDNEADVDRYFYFQISPPPRSVVAIVSSNDDARFSALPGNYSCDSWLHHRLSLVFTSIATSSSSALPLFSIPCLPEDEKTELLKLSQNNDLPSEVTFPCIHHYFEDIARTSPHLPALCFHEHSGEITTVSYGDMNKRCGALAGYLASSHGVGPGIIVPIFFARGIDMLIAIYAVLKAGASYVPLDPDHPPERTAVICNAVKAKVVLTQSALLDDVRGRLSGSTAVIALNDVQWLDHPDVELSGRGTGEDLAYVLFTSGTTGTPKGVMVHHTAVVNTTIDGPPLNRALRKRNNLRTFMFSNYAFDASIWDMFITLTSGGCLCLASKEATMDDLPGVMRRLSANFVMTTPTVLSLLETAEVPSLDTVYSCGEMLTPAVRDRFTQAGLTLGNVYGPTETTVSCTFDVVEDGTKDPTIIGKPFGWSRGYILDDQLRMVPHGAVGTLWIAGPQLSKGYLARPDLTEAAYRPDPFATGENVGQLMYNTGDLCAWVQDGYLKCYGRADDQMKIRGQRVETLEIEAVISRVPDVYATCVVKRVQDGREDLVAFYCIEPTSSADIPVVEKEIVETVTRHLPIYMRPSTLVHLDKLPVTVNGKADRRQLRVRAAELEIVAPVSVDDSSDESRTATEDMVAECWSTLLSIPIENVPLHRDFYECGGDSVTIIRLASALRARGLQLKTSDLRKATTVKAQAALAQQRGSNVAGRAEEKYKPFSLISLATVSLDSIVASMGYSKDIIEDVYPCSATVSGLVSLAASNPQSYYAQHAFKRSGHFDAVRLHAAWKAVVGRHPILRTAFVIPPMPATDILQVVLKAEASELHLAHDRVSSEADLERVVADYLELSRLSGFHLGIIPTRVALFESPTSSIMLFQIHHSQYDGWSLPIILNNVQEAYESLEKSKVPSITSPSLPYSDFIRWERQQSTATALTFWTNELEDATLLSWPKIPHDASEIATDTLITASWTPSGDLTKFCSERKVTASTLIRLALAVVLGIHGNTDDVLIGVVTSGRSGDLAGVENVVGPCIATLPFRIRLPPDASLNSVLSTVQERSTAAAAYEYIGLADILKASPFSRSLFQVLLTVENIPELDLHNHPLFGEDVHGHQMEMNYPLGVTVFLLPGNRGLKIDIEYDSHHLSEEDVHWFRSHLLATLDAILESPSSTVADIDIVTDEERGYLQDVGIGLTPDPELAAEPFCHRLFERVARKHPYRIAVEHTSGQELTYAEVEAQANRAAHGLRARGVTVEVPIPVLFNKDADQSHAVVGIMAVMKSGGAFVPLDVSWPLARLLSCIRQCSAPFVLCDSDVPEIARELPVPFVTVAELARLQSPEVCINEDQTPNSLAYVIFTSGSTGEPKGVMIEHRNIMGYVANGTTVYPIKDVKRLLHFSPFSFDQGLGDIFMALTKGATLVLANMSDVLTDLSNVLNSTRVDYTVLTPAIAQLIRNDVEHPYLKSLLVGGEKLPGQLVDRWKGQVAFMDDYGPTEVTVSCVGMTFTAHTKAAAGVIGRSYGDTRAYIVDTRDPSRLLPVGAVGELCLSGNQVGRGYLNRPDLTAAAFIPDPFAPGLTMYRSGDRARWTSDGFIEYLGRQDDAFVKLRGLRIDTGEVEDAITGVGETFAVVELLQLRGQPHLVTFMSKTLAPTGEAKLELAEPRDEEEARKLKAWLQESVAACRQAVPVYAVPTVWLALRAMPQNTNSKFDRKQLKAFYKALASETIESFSAGLTQSHAPRSPETALEKTIAKVWSDVLGREAQSISVYDDFFSLGGDSIGVVRMLSGLKTLGFVISLKDFTAGPTVADLAVYFGASSSLASSSPDVGESLLPGQGNGLVWQVQVQENGQGSTPLWMIHDGGGLGNEYKNLTSLSRDIHAISNPTTTLAELRSQFPTMASYVAAYTPLISSASDIFLGGWSVGGMLALALAQKRLAAGQRVRGVVLIDSFNSEGWRYTGSPLDSEHGNDKLSAEEFSRVHQAHVDGIIGRLTTKRCDVPVLLVRAGIGMGVQEIEQAGFAVPYLNRSAQRSLDSGIGGLSDDDDLKTPTCTSPEETNFWTRSVLPQLEVVTVEGADHYSLMRDGALCAKASAEVAKWLARIEGR